MTHMGGSLQRCDTMLQHPRTT